MLPIDPARRASLPLLLLALSATPVAAQLQGRVLDAATGESIAASRILLLDAQGDTVASTQTRGDGRFGVFGTLDPGEYLIGASFLGYEVGWTLFEYGGTPMAFEFQLTRAPLALEGIDVEVKAERKLAQNGFYDRARGGFGDHLEFTDPRSRIGANRPSQLMRRLAGVAVSPGGAPYFTRVQGGRLGTGGRLCEPAVWVDGIFVVGPFDDVAPPVEDIVAIEAYPTGGTTPAQWRSSNSGCGTLVVWTR